MEFVSFGAYQFGKSLSKMVPLIDLESRTTIQFFVRFHSRKSWSISQKIQNAKTFSSHWTGKNKNWPPPEVLLKSVCLSDTPNFHEQSRCWLSVIYDLLTIDLDFVKCEKMWRLSLIFDTLPSTFMGFSFVGGKSQKCLANWSKSTTGGGPMHNKAFFWLLNLSIKVRLFEHNFFSFVFNLSLMSKKSSWY